MKRQRQLVQDALDAYGDTKFVVGASRKVLIGVGCLLAKQSIVFKQMLTTSAQWQRRSDIPFELSHITIAEFIWFKHFCSGIPLPLSFDFIPNLLIFTDQFLMDSLFDYIVCSFISQRDFDLRCICDNFLRVCHLLEKKNFE